MNQNEVLQFVPLRQTLATYSIEKTLPLLITNVDKGVLTQLLTTENLLTWRADLVSSGNAG